MCSECQLDRILLHKRIIKRDLVFSKDCHWAVPDKDCFSTLEQREIAQGFRYIKKYYPLLVGYVRYHATSMDFEHFGDWVIDFFIEVR